MLHYQTLISIVGARRTFKGEGITNVCNKKIEPFVFAVDLEVWERTSSLTCGNYGKKTLIKSSLLNKEQSYSYYWTSINNDKKL